MLEEKPKGHNAQLELLTVSAGMGEEPEDPGWHFWGVCEVKNGLRQQEQSSKGGLDAPNPSRGLT